jgi:hypothetical protein
METSLDLEERFSKLLKSLGVAKPSDAEPTEEVETDESDDGGSKVAEKKIVSPTAINLFQHPDTHPIVLDIALLRKYGPEWLDWEAETLEWRVPQDFKASGFSDLNMNKVQACKALHLDDGYWLQWEVFNWCTMPFNNVYPDFEVMQVPTLAQVLVSIDIANRIREDVKWSDEVKNFIEVVYRHDGMFCPIPPADFVTIDSEGLPIDCEEVQKQWPEVLRTGRAPTEETVTAEQLRRGLTVIQFLEESRVILQNQLPLVLNA